MRIKNVSKIGFVIRTTKGNLVISPGDREYSDSLMEESSLKKVLEINPYISVVKAGEKGSEKGKVLEKNKA